MYYGTPDLLAEGQRSRRPLIRLLFPTLVLSWVFLVACLRPAVADALQSYCISRWAFPMAGQGVPSRPPATRRLARAPPRSPPAASPLRQAHTVSQQPVASADPPANPARGLEGKTLPPTVEAWVERLPLDLLFILDRMRATGHSTWLVGGCVRDILSDKVPWEIDLASTMPPDQMLALFPRALDTGSQYGTVTLRHGGVAVECTTLRADSPYSDGRRPDSVTFGDSLLEDLARRDFTINAMALDPHQRLLYDPFGGQQDLLDDMLRAVGDAQRRLQEDGLRALRGYRFMEGGRRGVRLPDAALAAALRDAPPLLDRISRERIWKEFRKILSGRMAASVVQRMAEDGILAIPRFLPTPLTAGSRGVRALQHLPPEHLPLWSAGDVETRWAKPNLTALLPDPLSHRQPPAKPQAFRYLGILDFEATCDNRPGFGPAEIIEVPLVLVDVWTGQVTDEFHSYVKPRINPSLTEFCTHLTGITQDQVDTAPELPVVLGRLVRWLEHRGLLPKDDSPPQMLLVCDGDWDLRSMLPGQLYRYRLPVPTVFHTWMDVRQLFSSVVAREVGGLSRMLQALGLRAAGRSHSGIDDARNIARVAVELLRRGAVAGPTSEIKRTNTSSPTPKVAMDRQLTFEELAAQTILARLALLLCDSPADGVQDPLKALSLGREDVRTVLRHLTYLERLPEPSDPGQLRRYRTAVGEHVTPVQLSLELALAHTADPARVRHVEAVRDAMALLPPLRAPGGREPLVTGGWLKQRLGLKEGKILGRLKDWLYFEQIDRDLATVEDIEALLAGPGKLPWETTAPDGMPARLW